jgi:membrane protease YdiL (CAAX protease family)
VPRFLNDDLELAPPWRFLAYTIAYVLLFVASSAVASSLIPGPVDFGTPRGLALGTLTFLPPAVLAFAFMLRFADRRPVAAFGITPHEGWGRDVARGLAIAAGMAGLYAGAAGLTGGLGAGLTPSSAADILLTVGLLAVAAWTEELVYRGYPLQALMQAAGEWPGLITMSAIFGLGHHLNPNATWLGTTNTFLAGILLSIAYLRTRSLWLPWGIHIGWNLATGVLLGLPVSGVEIASLLRVRIRGAEWLTGGAFGPEGGILATVAIIAAALFLMTTRQVGVSRTVRHALSTGAHGRQTVGRFP